MSRKRLGGLVAGFAVAMLLAAATAGASVVTISESGWVMAAKVSPDGTQVLTGSQSPDYTARLWNASTGALIRTFAGHTYYLTSVAFSPDGSQVLTGADDGTAKLWTTSTGSWIRTFTGHSSHVTSVAFSPDGTKVLTGSVDQTAKLWTTSTGAVIRTFTGHTNELSSVAFSPDGAQVLTGSVDQTAKLWTTATAALVRTFTGHTDIVRSAVFSPDGTKVLTGSDDHTAIMWNASTGAVIRTYTGHTNQVHGVAFSPDGNKVLTGSADHTARLWSASSSTLLQTLTGHTDEIFPVAFSPDGARVLTGSIDDTARLETIPVPKGTIVIDNNVTATNSASATLALTWSGGWGTGVTKMRFSDDGAHWTAWAPVAATSAHTLPAGDGYKTVRVQYSDSLGNYSAVFNDYIRMDTVAPTGTIIINNGASTTSSLSVALGLTWADVGAGVTRMRFSDNGSTWTAWESIKHTRAYTLPAGLGYHTVRVQFTDAASNYSPVYSDYIKVVAK